MGIDIYMKWAHQTPEEKNAQYTGFSPEHGHVGYLREAYHGEPYATKVLIPEGWDGSEDSDGYVSVPAAILRARLPETLLAAAKRLQDIYHEEPSEGHPCLRSFVEFVELAERKEAETGHPVKIICSW